MGWMTRNTKTQGVDKVPPPKFHFGHPTSTNGVGIVVLMAANFYTKSGTWSLWYLA